MAALLHPDDLRHPDHLRWHGAPTGHATPHPSATASLRRLIAVGRIGPHGAPACAWTVDTADPAASSG